MCVAIVAGSTGVIRALRDAINAHRKWGNLQRPLQNSSITKLCFVIPTERSDEESLLLITRFLTSVRNDKYAIIFALYSVLCTLYSVLCSTPQSLRDSSSWGAVITRDLPLQRLLEFGKLFNLLNKNALIFVNLLNSGYTTYRRMNRPYRYAIHLGMKRLWREKSVRLRSFPSTLSAADAWYWHLTKKPPLPTSTEQSK